MNYRKKKRSTSISQHFVKIEVHVHLFQSFFPIGLCPFREMGEIVPAARNEKVTSIRFDVLTVDITL